MNTFWSTTYGQCCELSDSGSKWECYISEDQTCIIPYMCRGDTGHIYSPYGYSGIVVDHTHIVQAMQEFAQHARDSGYVTFFIRQTPYFPLPSHVFGAFPNLRVHTQRTCYTIAMTHEVPYERIIAPKQRTALRKAIKSGYRWEMRRATMLDDFTALAERENFRTLYDASMRSKNTTVYYLFSDEYYQALEHTPVYVAYVYDNTGARIGASLFFRDKQEAVYHLSAMKPGYANVQVFLFNAFVTDTAVTRVLLGCGMKENDSLAAFKRSVSNQQDTYYTYAWILDTERYNALSAASTLHNSAHFPPYRTT